MLGGEELVCAVRDVELVGWEKLGRGVDVGCDDGVAEDDACGGVGGVGLLIVGIWRCWFCSGLVGGFPQFVTCGDVLRDGV